MNRAALLRTALAIGTLTAGAPWIGKAHAEWRFVNPPTPARWDRRVTGILEDRRRDLWFATDGNGVFRSDGVAWQHYDLTNGLGGNVVRELAEDGQGRVWIATDGGLSVYDGNRMTVLKAVDLGLGRECPTSDDFWTVRVAPSGNVYAATEMAIARLDSTGWHPLADCAFGPFAPPIEERAGGLWVAAVRGEVWHVNGSDWQPQNVGARGITEFLQDRGGRLWVFSEEGIHRRDSTGWRRITDAELGLDPEYSMGHPRGLLLPRDGSVAAATWHGTFRCDGAQWSELGDLYGDFPTVTLSAMAADSAGRLWRGDGDVGLARWDGAAWINMTLALGYLTRPRVFVDRSGHVWCTDESGMVAVLDGPQWNDNGGFQPTSVIEDSSHTLWGFGSPSGNPTGMNWHNGAWWDGPAESGPTYLAPRARHGMLDRHGAIWAGVEGVGVGRYAAGRWEIYTSDTLDFTRSRQILETRDGSIWVVAPRADLVSCQNGAARFDGTTWRIAAGACPDSLAESASGRLWGASDSAVHEYDGQEWRSYARLGGSPWTPDAQQGAWIIEGSLGSPYFLHHVGDGSSDYRRAVGFPRALLQGRDGALWVASSEGVGVIVVSPSRFEWFRRDHGLIDTDTQALFEDRDGGIWALPSSGRYYGASRWDGAAWTPYRIQDGIQAPLQRLFQGGRGEVWGTSNHALARFADSRWLWVPAPSGPSTVHHVSLSGSIDKYWIGVASGLFEFEPDTHAPRACFSAIPPRLASSRDLSAAFTVGFGDSDVEFSVMPPGDTVWSAWSPTRAWTGRVSADGTYVIRLRARDAWGNIDTVGTSHRFEVDATPPAPVFAWPAFGEAVRDSVTLRGTAADLRFRDYSVDVRPEGTAVWSTLAQSATPVSGGTLAGWDTRSLPDGPCDLRLSVRDTLGLAGTAQVTVIVDNQPPFADQTTPAKVTAATGGDVYTTNGEVRLYFPPHAFREDATVTILPVTADDVPDRLPSGAVRMLPGHQLSWNAAALQKPARLELSFTGADGPPPGDPAIHASTDGTTWRRLGGTVSTEGRRITLEVSEPGRYALYAGGSVPEGDRTLSPLSFSPRVFSPTGGFADREVGIGFTLGQSGPVTVRVYNRAGWLVREVASAVGMGPGANLVRWDGRDRQGAVVVDGLYLVSVEALGHTQTRTLAVVR